MENDPGTLDGERLRDGGADPARTARDEDDSVLKKLHVFI